MSSIIKVDTIQNQSGANIISESSNTITVGASGDTTNVIGTLNKDGVAVENTPAFSATKSGQTTGQSDSTWTKITYDTELLDSDGKFADSRFTPTIAGKYFITLSATTGTSSASSLEASSVGIYKNGSQITGASNNSKTENEVELADHTASCIVELDTNDYIEGYVYINNSTGTNRITTSQLSGYRIIGA